ncbi:MAG TPA: hypothetical protein PKK36_09530 [Kiritimatiellia bacterium]|nr:hypothetical protein [Kiritimatiellia bacterium]
MKNNRFAVVILSILLFVMTFALFSPALSFSLVSFDDPVFITHNPIIFNGFSWEAIRSAFTKLHGDECMYVPLLWISYLLDLKFFGASSANPWGFHFTSIFFHALNSVLLYLLLYAFCRKPWRALFFAAIWALHPLRVESVAWVTSRKDVLSTFFALLCILAYVQAWTAKLRENGSARAVSALHVTAFVFFILGLLVKPMLVTIPFLLLLLDIWPLRRLEGMPRASLSPALLRVLREKIPYFLGAAGAAMAVYLTQTKAMSTVPLWVRLYCIPSNYLFYLYKFLYPVRLFAMVPRQPVAPAYFLLSTAFLGSLTAWIWMRRREQPHMIIGWLTFLGLLFPVIGIVVIGIYPVADRYSYFPSIGLSIALLFAFSSKALPNRGARAGRNGLAVCVLLTLALLTLRLLPSWKNDRSMYAHIARLHPDHYAAIHYQAREELFANGNIVKADRMASQMLEIKPCVSFGLVLKIICLSQLQSTEAALEFARENYPPCDNLGNPGIYEGYLTTLNFFAGQYEQANHFMEETFRRSVFEPKTQEQLHAIAMLLAHQQGNDAAALAYAAKITALKDKKRLLPEDYFLSYTALWSSGLYVQALPFFQKLAQSSAGRPDILNNIAWLLATTSGSPADPEEVIQMVNKALEASPGHPVILDTLSVAQANAGDFDAALRTAEKVAAFLKSSTATDAPQMLRKVEKRIALYRERKPFREYSATRLLYAP